MLFTLWGLPLEVFHSFSSGTLFWFYPNLSPKLQFLRPPNKHFFFLQPSLLSWKTSCTHENKIPKAWKGVGSTAIQETELWFIKGKSETMCQTHWFAFCFSKSQNWQYQNMHPERSLLARWRKWGNSNFTCGFTHWGHYQNQHYHAQQTAGRAW